MNPAWQAGQGYIQPDQSGQASHADLKWAVDTRYGNSATKRGTEGRRGALNTCVTWGAWRFVF